MSQVSSFGRSLAIISTFGLALAGVTAPAFATGTKGPKPVVVNAGTFKDETSKLCMPNTNTDRSAPKTLCQTRAEWEAQGVTFVVK